MDSLSADMVSLLNYLLPGLLSAWIFFGLTAHPKPSSFERVIQALIYTIIIQFVVAVCQLADTFSAEEEIILSVSIAVVLGLVVAILANHDFPHRALRWLKATKETSYPSEWYGVLFNSDRYVTLHLRDGRRIMGLPEDWPANPDAGHFSLRNSFWLSKEDSAMTPVGGDRVIISATDITMVLVMKEAEVSDVRRDATDTTKQ